MVPELDYMQAQRAACLNHVVTAEGLGLCEAPERLTGQLLGVNVNPLEQYIAGIAALSYSKERFEPFHADRNSTDSSNLGVQFRIHYSCSILKQQEICE